MTTRAFVSAFLAIACIVHAKSIDAQLKQLEEKPDYDSVTAIARALRDETDPGRRKKIFQSIDTAYPVLLDKGLVDNLLGHLSRVDFQHEMVRRIAWAYYLRLKTSYQRSDREHRLGSHVIAVGRTHHSGFFDALLQDFATAPVFDPDSQEGWAKLSDVVRGLQGCYARALIDVAKGKNWAEIRKLLASTEVDIRTKRNLLWAFRFTENQEAVREFPRIIQELSNPVLKAEALQARNRMEEAIWREFDAERTTQARVLFDALSKTTEDTNLKQKIRARAH